MKAFGIIFLAFFIDIFILRADLYATITAILMVSIYKSPSGFSVLLDPQFWTLIFGAVVPWLALTGLLLIGAKIAELMPDVSSDARGGIVMLAVLPVMIASLVGVVAFFTALFRMPRGSAKQAFLAGIMLHHPGFFFRQWFT